MIKYIIPLLAIISSKAQPHTAINTYLSTVYKENVMPGFAVLVLKDRNTIFNKGYGVEQLGIGKQFTPKSVSGIGSLTKSLTTLAVLQLVEQKKLALDRPIVQYIPWFRTVNKQWSDKITLRMLLSNTSGLLSPSIEPNYSFDNQSLENVLRALSHTYITLRPGESYEYSNVGFCVAGYLVAKISGQSYQDYLKDHIFKPLQMDQSTCDPSEFAPLGALHGHYFGIDRAILAKREINLESGEYLPAGVMTYSSAQDLSHYLQALLSDKHPIISDFAKKEMWKPHVTFLGLNKNDGGEGNAINYGLGWMMSKIENRNIIFHGGSTGTMSSFVMLDPINKIGACILMNLDMTFINKYKYASTINILNNVMRLTMGLKPNSYGIPIIKDPSLQADFILKKEDENKYCGKYQNQSVGNFIFDGADLNIFKENDKLKGSFYRNDETINEFELDFVNPTLAMARNLAMPVHLHFELSSKGQVKTVNYGSIKMMKIDENKIIENRLRINKSASLSQKEIINLVLSRKSIKREGEKIGITFKGAHWEQQSFLVTDLTGKSENVLLLSKADAQFRYWAVLHSPPEKFTYAVQKTFK